jgi:hypothetical protein
MQNKLLDEHKFSLLDDTRNNAQEVIQNIFSFCRCTGNFFRQIFVSSSLNIIRDMNLPELALDSYT